MTNGEFVFYVLCVSVGVGAVTHNPGAGVLTFGLLMLIPKAAIDITRWIFDYE